MINALLFAMNSRFYVTTSGRVDNVDTNTVIPFLDSADDEIMKLKHDDDSITDVASAGIQNREFANNAAALAGGLVAGQFYVTTAGGSTTVKVVV